VLALVVGTLGFVGPVTAASATPTPSVPDYGPDIDAYADYEAEDSCRYPEVQPGVLEVQGLIEDTYGSYARSFHTTRYCSGSGGSSGHHEGRALDWMLDAYDGDERAIAESYLDWLLATDKYGNEHAMARRMGLTYIIWNRQIFRMYRPSVGWQPYTGANPHSDHIHLSFSWAGAREQTSFYTHDDGRSVPGGCTPGASGCPVDRVAGDTQYATSVAIGQETFPDAETVVIVSSDEGRRADGAVAAPFAYDQDAPVLLSASDGLSDVVVDDIERRGVDRAYLVGGTIALSDNVEDQLRRAGVDAVTRFAGDDRYHTAAMVADAMDVEPSAAFVASGDEHHLIDALAAGGIGAHNQWPVLLTEQDSVPAVTRDALEDLGVSRTYAVGGVIPISNGVVDQLPGGRRIAGDTLYDTAEALADSFASVGTDRVVIASGHRGNIIDVLGGGTFGDIILLTERNELTRVTERWLADYDVAEVVLVGGPQAVSDNTGRDIAEVLLR
jgi:putative cell wall-binding protein